jgi:MoaA/NifB/PqqE/SkfB family radical SAM enzyme
MGFVVNSLKNAVLKNRYGTPPNLVFFVTSSCNSRCRTCFNWRNLDSVKKDELTLEEISRISASMGRMNALAISGGEPFLREDLADICSLFREQNRVDSMFIPTNGTLPDVISRVTRDILERCGCEISIGLSLDGTESVHNRIRGVRCFRKVLETYRKLVPLAREFRELKIKVDSTVTKENFKNLLELAAFVRKEMPEVGMHSFELIRGNPRDPGMGPPSPGELRDFARDLNRIWDSYHYDRNSRLKSFMMVRLKKYLMRLYIRTMEEKRQLIPCYAGRIWGVLEANGDIRLCELLDPVGNIRKFGYDFRRAWSSPKAGKQRGFIKDKKCYCTHTCFQLYNAMSNPRLYPGIITS